MGSLNTISGGNTTNRSAFDFRRIRPNSPYYLKQSAKCLNFAGSTGSKTRRSKFSQFFSSASLKSNNTD
jgi:hypothetical protein